MCGIAGIIYRHPELYNQLGDDLLKLIQPLESRGPDSCGVGIYGNSVNAHHLKVLLLAETTVQWEQVRQWLNKVAVSYTHLRAHETPEHLVCRLLLEKKKTTFPNSVYRTPTY